VRLQRFALGTLPGLVATASLVVLLAGPAAATVTGPCTAELNGTPVTVGHDTAGSAIHVDYRENAQYSGEATTGQTLGGVQVAIQIAGLDIRKHSGQTNGSKWADTVDVKKYAWAGIGLYRVTASATDEGGAPVCSGAAYICVDGKPFLLTVVGAVAALLALAAVYLLVRGLLGLRWRSRLRVAYRFGGAGLLGGIAAPLLLQQSCVLPLTQTIALASAGGGLIGMILVALLVGGRRRRRAPEAPLAAPPRAAVVPAQPRDRQQASVYKLVPDETACIACRNHAAHRTYRTAEAAAADRAHEDCDCEIAPEVVKDPFLMARFGGRDVIDDRDG
jgi:hypothetical protein